MTRPAEFPPGAARLQIATARAEDLPGVCAFLAAASLPGSDLGVDHMRHFCLARSMAPSPETGRSAMSSRTQSGALSDARAQGNTPERSEDRIVGIVGLEIRAPAALLRSLAVAPDQQGRGIGQALTETAESQAREHGIGDLFLLTTTAETFFARLGYAIIPRTDVPAELRAVPEFSSLCPAAALCMRKRLSA